MSSIRRIEKKIIGIDIGGTTIKADLYDVNGKNLRAYKEVATQIDYDHQTNNILEQVCCLVDEYLQHYSVEGVGISTAGVVNSKTGEVVYAGYTIPNYRGTNFVKTIKHKFNLSATVENDVNCAALGEAWCGNAKGISNVIMITIGTGIGGSILIDGNLMRGYNFTAGEVGYLPVKGTDWQNIASTTALLKLYKEKKGGRFHTGRSFFKAVRQEDPDAIETLDIFIDNLAEGILMISYLLNPEAVILGGGILSESSLIVSKINNCLLKKVQDCRFLPKKILAASLGNEAGRIGAVKNYLNFYE